MRSVIAECDSLKKQEMQRISSLRSPITRIRQSTAEDEEFFFAMEEQTTWESLPPDKARTLQREQLSHSLRQTHQTLLSCPGSVVFIAEVVDEKNGGNIERAGLLWFGLRHNLLTGDDEGWIYNVTTDAAWRGRGVARRMLEYAEEYARNQGHTVIGLCVAVHNEVARDCYARLDYEPSNIIMRKVLAHDGCAVRNERAESSASNNYCGSDVLLK